MISIDFCHVDTILISTRRHFRETARSNKNGANIWQKNIFGPKTKQKIRRPARVEFRHPPVHRN